MEFKAVRGTKDILPDTVKVWQYIEGKAKKILECYGYQEIRTPIFEETNLFVRGIGETTDIVSKEMYTFLDKKGRSLTLRPEGTAPVVRAYIEHRLDTRGSPIRLYYFGPMFRYERPQAGRQRQFWQLGIEVLGTSHPSIDAEVIDMTMYLLQELGLNELEVQINSVGCGVCRPRYKEALIRYLSPFFKDLCKSCKEKLSRNPMRILDCKVCFDLKISSPVMIEFLCDRCKDHFEGVKEYLDMLEVTFILKPHLVRGLDYYTNTCFEIIDKNLGAQDAVCAGGRYDGLVEEFGGKPTPAFGASAGIERIIVALEKQGVDVPSSTKVDVYFATIGSRVKKKVFSLVKDLRKKDISTIFEWNDKSLKASLREANRLRSRFVVIIGDTELNRNQAILKDMETGEQKEISLSGLVNVISNLLRRGCK
ncbi:MAG: histidine--tRNA ligase [bacterium]|nr:histidine--tRNA ligase [bacterium]